MTAISHVSSSPPHVHQGKPLGKPPVAGSAPVAREIKTDNLGSGKSVNRTA